jgi:glycosyltransferase involved in cell wall biosynthesis
MVEDLPLISVITIVYNSESRLEKTILSIIGQTYSRIEYIIVDGSSTDGTIDIIRHYSNRIACWVSEPDKGIYDAMNKGVGLSKGRYINFMNSGDEFYNSTTIESIFGERNNYDDIIYGDTYLLNSNKMSLSKSLKIDSIRFGMPFCHQSVFVKSAILKNRNFSLVYSIAADYDFFMSVYTNRTGSFKKLNFPLSIYEVNGASMSISGIKEQAIICAIYFPHSYASLYHRLRLAYYNMTGSIKMFLPKGIRLRVISIKRWITSIIR